MAPRLAARRLASLAGVTATCLGYLAAAGSAYGQGVVVADLASPPELRDDAVAISLLIRSMLASPRRPLVARADIAAALQSLAGSAPRDLVVPPDVLETLVQRLKADRTFVGTLAGDGKRLVASGQVMGPSGGKIADITAAAPVGEPAQLAREIARRLAPRVDATFDHGPAPSFGQLQPYVAASTALLGGDRDAAARALALGDPEVGAAVSAAAELGATVSADAQAPLEHRIASALAVGDKLGAAKLAEEVLAAAPDDPAARAGMARVFLVMKNLTAADRELERLRKLDDHPAVLFARAELALKIGTPAARTAALRPILGAAARGEPSAPSLLAPVLAAVGRTAHGALAKDLEIAVVEAARHVASKHPAVASAVGLRAVRGGVDLPRAFKLIRASDLRMDDLALIRPTVEAAAKDDDEEAIRLRTAIAQREAVAREIRLSRSGGVRSGGLSSVAVALGPALQPLLDFKRKPQYAMLLPMAGGGQPFYWPFAVVPDRLREALGDALTGAPFDMGIIDAGGTTEWIEETATKKRLGELAAGEADVVILYRLLAIRLNIEVRLEIFDVETKTMSPAAVTIPFYRTGYDTGLGRVQPIPIVGATMILAVLFGLALFAVAHVRGSIMVTVTHDPGAKDEMLTLVINRSPTIAPIANNLEYAQRLQKTGKTKTRFGATRVEGQTRFQGIASGRWWVHLQGTYSKAGQVRALDAGLSREVDVVLRRTAFVNFNLEPNYAEFHVIVYDGDAPVGGARAWVDDEKAKPVPTNNKGKCVILVPRGKHVVRVQAKELLIERPFNVFKTSAQELKINLVWERRMDDASRALEQQAPENPDGFGGTTLKPPGGPKR